MTWEFGPEKNYAKLTYHERELEALFERRPDPRSASTTPTRSRKRSQQKDSSSNALMRTKAEKD